MFGKLFKPRPHYVYDYKPRYYDERKERIQKLEEKYHKKDSSDDDSFSFRLSKTELRGEWKRNKRTASDRNTTIRLAIIIAALIGVFSYIFKIHTLF